MHPILAAGAAAVLALLPTAADKLGIDMPKSVAVVIVVAAILMGIWALYAALRALKAYLRDRKKPEPGAPLPLAPEIQIAGPDTKTNVSMYAEHEPVGDLFEVARVLVVNSLRSDDPRADIRHVRPVIEYLGAADQVVARSSGIWGDQDSPASRPLGQSVDDLSEVTLRANGVPQRLEVAIHYHDDDDFHVFDVRSYENVRARGVPDLRTNPSLPNPTKVRISFTAAMPKSPPYRAFLVGLDNGSLTIKDLD